MPEEVEVQITLIIITILCMIKDFFSVNILCDLKVARIICAPLLIKIVFAKLNVLFSFRYFFPVTF